MLVLKNVLIITYCFIKMFDLQSRHLTLSMVQQFLSRVQRNFYSLDQKNVSYLSRDILYPQQNLTARRIMLIWFTVFHLLVEEIPSPLIFVRVDIYRLAQHLTCSLSMNTTSLSKSSKFPMSYISIPSNSSSTRQTFFEGLSSCSMEM